MVAMMGIQYMVSYHVCVATLSIIAKDYDTIRIDPKVVQLTRKIINPIMKFLNKVSNLVFTWSLSIQH